MTLTVYIFCFIQNTKNSGFDGCQVSFTDAPMSSVCTICLVLQALMHCVRRMSHKDNICFKRMPNFFKNALSHVNEISCAKQNMIKTNWVFTLNECALKLQSENKAMKRTDPQIFIFYFTRFWKKELESYHKTVCNLIIKLP